MVTTTKKNTVRKKATKKVIKAVKTSGNVTLTVNQARMVYEYAMKNGKKFNWLEKKLANV